MGNASEIFRMSFISFVFFASLCNSRHFSNAESLLSEVEDFHLQRLQQMQIKFLEEERRANVENHIESGLDGQEEGSVVKKYRALLELRRFLFGRSFHGEFDHLAPSPSPSSYVQAEAPSQSPGPAPAPAPAPVAVLHTHRHFHSSPHHRHWIPPPHKSTQFEDKGRTKYVIAAVLVPTGLALLICAFGFIWFSKKIQKQRKKHERQVSMYHRKVGTESRSNSVNTQNSKNKVSANFDLDLISLNPLCLNTEQNANNISNHTNPEVLSQERKELTNREVVNSSESGNASISCAKEIVAVNENVEPIKYDNCAYGDQIIPIESNALDDESFHSLGESNSSNLRLSNASAGSLNETAHLSPKVLQSNSPLANSQNSLRQMTTSPPCDSTRLQGTSESSMCLGECPTPPPPPPPPLSTTHSSYSSTRVATKSISHSPSSNNHLSTRNPESTHSGQDVLLHSHPHSPKKGSHGIPAPPCPPPPILRGNITPMKASPAPPPPSQLPQFMTLGKEGSPLPKLKPLHWDKVRAAPDRSTVWDKLRSSSFELDEEMIESLFGYNMQNAVKNEEAKSKSPSPTKHVLEPKRLQNITILAKALNLTAEQVWEALVKGEGLSLQQLEALAKMIPTKDEEVKLSNYNGNPNDLGSAERFVKEILKVPHAFSRVEAMLYKETFVDEVVHLRNSFLMLEEACKELRSSRLFLKLLETVLKTGNRMNVGTIRGGAKAFKLDALLKLADVKGTDGKTTLLHFVVQEIVRSEGIRVSDSIMGRINQRNKNRTDEEKEEDYRRMGLELVSGLSTELHNVKKTASIDLDVLAGSVTSLTDGMSRLQHLVQVELHDEDEKNGTSSFVSSMKSFLFYTSKNLKELQGDEEKVLLLVKEITEYFHGNLSKEESNPLRIFVIVRDFLGMLDNVCKELRRSRVPRSPNPLAQFR